MRVSADDQQLPLNFTGASTSPPSVVLSYGLGVDSTAILLRWLLEPSSRDFDLSDLLVITAMTGDEWDATVALTQQHILPLMSRYGVRYVQVARTSASQSDGATVLDDSTSPTVVHGDGVYTLGEELLTAGTVPQRGGARLCSAKAKGFPLDTVINRVTAGKPFRHVLGFEKNEERRARKDATYNTAVRTGEYPLISWGWDRDACLEFIRTHLGVNWPKSACVYCPFAWSSVDGRAAAVDRFEQSPDEAAQALVMEYVAVALNPTQTLTDKGPLWDLVGPRALAAFNDRLAATRHAVYEVRRVFRAHADDPARAANASRSVRVLDSGSPAAMRRSLELHAAAAGKPVSVDGPHARVWLRDRPTRFPGVEHVLVVAPAVVADKQLPGFEQWWAAALAVQDDLVAIA